MINQKQDVISLTHLDLINEYSAYEGMIPISTYTQSIEKDIILSLIADMVLQGTTSAELWRVIKHSMVVMDAEKHNLDYKRSAKDNGIAQLITKYQGASND